MDKFKEFSIHSICDEYGIGSYSINSDGSIDCRTSVDIGDDRSKYKKVKFKLPLKFNKVMGDFFCDNCELETLIGSPKFVGGVFDCSGNKLKSLKHGPESAKSYSCGSNHLTSLEGAPKSATRLHLQDNNIKSFRGIQFGSNYKFFRCEGNPIYEVYYLFKDLNLDHTKCIDLINEYDVIQGDFIIEDRLLEVFYELDLEPKSDFNFNSYELI